MDNFSFILGSQIRYLVSSLSKKNYRTSVAELEHLITLYGHDAYLYLLRCLMEQIDLKDSAKSQQRFQLLQQQLLQLIDKPNFPSVLFQALSGLELKEDFLNQLSKALKLNLAQDIVLALGLAQAPEKSIRHEGRSFLRIKLPEVENNVSLLPESLLHSLLYYLGSKDGFAKQRAALAKALQASGKPLSLSLLVLASDDKIDLDSRRGLEERTDEDADSEEALIAEISAAVHPSELMQDIGHQCCQTAANLKELLKKFPDANEADVAAILAMMLRTSAEGEEGSSEPSGWNLGVFVDTIKELHPKLNWALVVKSLDRPDFYIADAKAIHFILNVYKRATKEPFPVDAVTCKWLNTRGQLSFLQQALALGAEAVNFASTIPQPTTFTLDLPHPNKSSATQVQNWHNLALIERLLNLAESEGFDVVKEIFKGPLETCPELLLLKLAQLQSPWGILYWELCSELLALFLGNHPNSSYVLQKLWGVNRSLVMRGMVESYNKDAYCLSRLLDVAHDIKALSPILEIRPFAFAIDLAALASRREYLNLEKWLQDRINEHQLEFVVACLSYLKEKKKAYAKNSSSTKGSNANSAVAALSADTLGVFFTVMQANINMMPADMVEEFDQLQSAHAIQLSKVTATQGMNAPSGGASTDPPAPEKEGFPKEIEKTANAYFQSVYTGQVSIDEIVTLLKNFKASKNKREQKIFSCMVHNLFDEYRFFPKYPDKELRITGILFGQLIQNQLVSYISLGIALRYVLEALKKAPNTKMFKFGLFALQQFKSRLGEWPQYCSHILQIPHIRQYHPDIVEFIEDSLKNASGVAAPEPTVPAMPKQKTGDAAGTSTFLPGFAQAEAAQAGQPAALAGKAPVAKQPPATTAPAARPTTPPQAAPPASNVQPQSSAKTTGSASAAPAMKGNAPSFHMGNQLPLEAILQSITPASAPDETIKDKIFFVFNNVSKQNMDIKANELRSILHSEDWPYLAQHLVINRASIEPNFHALYLEFLDYLKIPGLLELVLNSTYAAIQALLRSQRITVNPAERTLLKNLGSWLGNLTLARNKPLIHKRLALKELVLEAYETGKLIALIPFAAKVLEACTKSKIFAPPNVWVMAIMRLFAEIYQIPELKLNLKFEIELLCNHMGLDLNEIKPTEALKDKLRPDSQDFTAPPPAAALAPAPTPAAVAEVQAPHVPVVARQPPISPPSELTPVAQQPQQPPLGTPLQFPTATPALPAGAAGLWKINPHIPLFSQQPHLKRCVTMAIDKAIKEILTPVMERSATIASITTRELVLKDFALEPDEQIMRTAAHYTVQSLASSLAMVACKEPLRVSIASHLRSLLQANVSDQAQRALIEHAVQTVCTDNLDTACALIEKTTAEKALRETDDALAPALEARRKHRERAHSQPYIEPNFFSGRYPSSLPEPLRPKPGGLLPHQKRVYDEFSNVLSRTPRVQPAPPQVVERVPTPGAPAVAPTPVQPFRPYPTPIMAPTMPEGGDVSQISSSGLTYVVNQGTVNLSQQDARRSIHTREVASPVKTVKKEKLTTGQALQKFKSILHDLEASIAGAVTTLSSLEQLPEDHPVLHFLDKIPTLITNSINPNEVALAIAQKIFKRMYEKIEYDLQIDTHIAILEHIRDVCKKIVKELTNWIIYSDADRKFHRIITIGLINSRLLKATDFDVHLSKKMDSGRSKQAVDFAILVLQKCMVEPKEPTVTASEFFNTLEVLTKIAQRGAGPEGLMELITQAKSVTKASAEKLRSPRKLARSRDASEAALSASSQQAAMLPGMQTPEIRDPMYEQVRQLWEEWKHIYYQPNQSDKVFSTYLTQLQHNVLQSEDQGVVKSFFRVCTILAIEQSFNPTIGTTPQSQPVNTSVLPGQLSYRSVDAFSKLVVFLYKFSPEGLANANGTKLNLLNKVLDTVVRVLVKNYDTKRTKFNQRPFYRLFASLLIDLNSLTAETDPAHLQVLMAFSNCFMILSPIRVPGFCFAWLELVSHSQFMPKLLLFKSQSGWPVFQQLLVELFKFLEPYLVNVELNEPIRLLYKGTLRVLLVLLHDFPEFLCDYHFSFCDVIPPTCIQMRNLILSAFPRNMRLPDPFTPNLKVDLLPEISQPPRILSKYTAALTANKTFKQEVDNYLKTGQPYTFLLELRSKLFLPQGQALVGGTRYNVPLINALVLYVGAQAVAQLHPTTSQPPAPINQSAPMNIFQHLALDLDTEGRYLFLNAIANQLRYPNNHTHYFTSVLLYLFAEANQGQGQGQGQGEQSSQEIIQEQITRVLLERLIVNRPHPWGLLITFIELIKNPRYNFWSHSFTRCAPEIERLFESVARSCMGPGPGGAPKSDRPGLVDK